MKEELKSYYQNSIIPIFAHLPDEHEKVELVGTGLYAKYNDMYLIVSDRHVIKDKRLKEKIVIPNNSTNQLEVAPTTNFITCDNPEIDLGFYILSEPLNSFSPIELKRPVTSFKGNNIRFVGYPASKAKCKYSDVKGKPYAIEGILSGNTGFKILIDYDEKNIYIDGKKTTPQDLHGISGGPAFIYNDNEIELIGFTESVDPKEKKLAATRVDFLYKLLEKYINENSLQE